MEKKKGFLYVLLIFSLLAMGVSTIYAMTSVEFINSFVVGHVDVRVEGYQKEGGEEVLWQESGAVLPGEVLSRIPRIYNEGNDCYVRVKASLGGEGELSNQGRDVTELADMEFVGMEKEWILAADGYYYYPYPIPQNGTIDLFQGILIPDDLPQEIMENKTLHLDVAVDAIQSANVKPDYAAPLPWGPVKILQYVESDSFDITYVEPTEEPVFHMIYLGNTDQWLTNGNDLFAKVSCFLPGDVYRDSIHISNEEDQDMCLYFRNASPMEMELLEKLRLKITWTSGGETLSIYDGDMRAAALSENTLLGIISAREEARVDFQIQVPQEIDNEYARFHQQIRWIFSNQPISGRLPDTTGAVATGDSAPWGVCLGLLGCSLMLGTYAIKELRKGRKQNG